ncbi:glycosyltransferase family 4 protein [Cloacibacillus porcorum]|nr:glycosyltransferase family 4 protein [Cloacibacillus porcorum]
MTLLVADGKKDEISNGVNIVSIDYAPTSRYKRILLSGHIMFKAARQIDAEIYHLHDPELLPLGKRLKRCGKKVIFDSHENVSGQIMRKEWIPKILRLPISIAYTIYANHILKKMDYIIAVTPTMVVDLEKTNFRVELITNYPIIDTSQHYDKTNIHEDPIFVFAGGISKQWCHDTILKALREVNAKYLLMGWGESSYLADLKNDFSWKKVIFLGKVPQEEVKEQLKNCTAGLAVLEYSPNTNGKMGTLGNTKLFEYMQAGLPVICTDFILWKDIIDKWNCGLCVSPNNIEELHQAMSYLIDNPSVALEMGYNGRKAIFTEFNWGIEEKKLLSLYKNLIMY